MLFGKRPFGDDLSQEKILSQKTILNATTVEFPAKPAVSDETKVRSSSIEFLIVRRTFNDFVLFVSLYCRSSLGRACDTIIAIDRTRWRS
jgi:hypothetical protein